MSGRSDTREPETGPAGAGLLLHGRRAPLAAVAAVIIPALASGCETRGARTRVEDAGPEGDARPICGNGVIEPGEWCDGQDVGLATCPDVTLHPHGNVRCTPYCDLDTSACHTCGNGLIEGPEQCDGQDLAGHTCRTLTRHDQGQLVCSAVCTFAAAGCHTCGDGVLHAEEECDDGNLAPGDGCSPDCTAEYICGDGTCESDDHETCRNCPRDCCPECGNGIREPHLGEECDTDDLAGLACEDLCYDGGAMGCTAWCELDISQCTGPGPICGDGEVECQEQCDGANLNGQTCQTLGYSSGQLACNPLTCLFDLGNCSGLLWYLVEDFEGTTVPGWQFNGQWELGIPTTGPGSAHGGQNCAATVLAGDYGNNQDAEICALVSPEVNLTAAFSPTLTYWQWVETESNWDGGTLWVSTDNGLTWTYLDNTVVEPDYDLSPHCNSSYMAYTGDHAHWQLVTVSLTAYAGQNIRLRWSFCSDSSITYPGWYVDDVLVSE